MNREEILEAICDLGGLQGFYGRLYSSLINGSEEFEKILDDLVCQNFTNIIDLIIYLEG